MLHSLSSNIENYIIFHIIKVISIDNADNVSQVIHSRIIHFTKHEAVLLFFNESNASSAFELYLQLLIVPSFNRLLQY